MRRRGKLNLELRQDGSALLRFPLAFSREELALKLEFSEQGCLVNAAAKPYLERLWQELFFMLRFGRFHQRAAVVQALTSYLLSDGSAPEGIKGRKIIRAVEVEGQCLQRESLAALKMEISNFGRVYIVYEDREFGIYRLVIAPGKSIAPHHHQLMDEVELVLTDGLLLQGRPVPSGLALQWPRNFPHAYHNPTCEEQVVLCIDHPPFIPADEQALEVTTPLPFLNGKRRQHLWK
jgi:hypothetical protein